MDEGGGEPCRTDVLVREPGQGLLWCAGMFGLGEAFPGEVAQQLMEPVPDESGRVRAEQPQHTEGELLGLVPALVAQRERGADLEVTGLQQLEPPVLIPKPTGEPRDYRSCRIERVTPTHTYAPDGMLARDWRYAAMPLQRIPAM